MAKHQQEDPWAGFVDVLSNILMVVIFLVVILGISIFAISQQITKAAVDKAVKAERDGTAKPKGPDAPAEPVPQVSAAPAPGAAAPAAVAQATLPPSEPSPSEGEKGTAGSYQAARALRVRAPDDIAGNTSLSVRSLASDAKTIEVASEEVAPASGPVQVQSSQAFLTLKFTRGTFKIDEAASREIQAFLRGKSDVAGQKVEIRAFAQSTVGSVSEARRIAYYRAMQTRTELIKTGIPASKVELKMRDSASPEELDVVRIFAKP